MLAINTMRYGTDEFVMSKDITGLVFQNDTTWDCSNIGRCSGFSINYAMPTYTSIRIAFIVDGVLNKLDQNGALQNLGYTGEISNNQTTYDFVSLNGNWPNELTELSNVPGFVGKKVIPVIALMKNDSAENPPKISMSLKGVSESEAKLKNEITQAYDLDGRFIYKVLYGTDTSGGGSVGIEGALLNNAEWGEWMPVDSLKGKSGDQVRFRLRYGVSDVGNASAKLKYLRVYAKSQSESTGVITTGNTEIITKEQVFSTPMSYVRAYIMHDALNGAKITPYVSFSDGKKSCSMKELGTGTGEKQTIALEEQDVDFATLNLYEGQIPITDYGYDTETNEITFRATSGAMVYASYEYGRAEESWKAMEEVGTEFYLNDPTRFATCYIYSVPGAAKSISSIRIKLEQSTGTVTDEILGEATGREQVFLLSNAADPSTIVVKMNGLTHSQKNWSYDEESQSITAIGIKGRELTADYSWATNPPVIHKFSIAWNH